MKIALDVSPLQGPHRMRGIGAVLINIINSLSEQDKEAHKFVFYMEADISKDTFKDIDLDGIDYEIRHKPHIHPSKLQLPGKFNIFAKATRKSTALYRIKNGIKGYDYSGVDVYLHTDQMQVMPRMHGVKKIMIAYDVIPYIFERDYLWSYKTARKMGLSKTRSLAAWLSRYTYISKLKHNVKKSSVVLAISKQTKKDFVEFTKVQPDKVHVWYLGVDSVAENKSSEEPLSRFIQTSWGNIRRPYSIDKSIPFILFLGGTDSRRKLDDLATAFDRLKARGYNIKLFLSGDILEGPDNLPVLNSREALMGSSYKDDIVYFGFTNEAEKKWLYEHALAFVYPSKYEGFGLPVLEAMSYGTPVVAYRNAATLEIAGDAVLFADNSVEMSRELISLLDHPNKKVQLSEKGLHNVKKYTWDKTALELSKILELI